MSGHANRSARGKLSRAAAAAACAVSGFAAGVAWAAPYASNLSVSGTSVQFILNQDCDTLQYSINGGAAQSLTPTRGTHSFSLGSPTDPFSITAGQSSGVGFTTADGLVAPSSGAGLSQPTDTAHGTLISND